MYTSTWYKLIKRKVFSSMLRMNQDVDPNQKNPLTKTSGKTVFKNIQRKMIPIVFFLIVFTVVNVGYLLHYASPIIKLQLVVTLSVYTVLLFLFFIFLILIWDNPVSILVLVFIIFIFGLISGECVSYNVQNIFDSLKK